MLSVSMADRALSSTLEVPKSRMFFRHLPRPGTQIRFYGGAFEGTVDRVGAPPTRPAREGPSWPLGALSTLEDVVDRNPDNTKADEHQSCYA